MKIIQLYRNGLTVLVILYLMAMFGCSLVPSFVPIIDASIQDEDVQVIITTRINEEGVRNIVNDMGIIMVPKSSVIRMRMILICENLVPQGIEPWAIFDQDRWSMTDFERNVNFRRAQTKMIIDHIKAIDDIDDANVTLNIPDRELFAAVQQPTKASVIITPKPNSNITQNWQKLEGIHKLLTFAIPGLTDENIVITDHDGIVLNDFTSLAALGRMDIIEQKQIQRLETRYRTQLLQALQAIFSSDRVRDLNIKIDFDATKEEQIERITVSVNIDGWWRWRYDERGNPVILPDGSIEREYTPVPPEQLRAAMTLIQNAIGFNAVRGDSVTVKNIPFDRRSEFAEEDAAYFRKQQVQTTIKNTLFLRSLLRN